MNFRGKKIGILLLLVSIGSMEYPATVVIPDWKTQVALVKEAISGLKEILLSDADLYQKLGSQITDVFSTFEKRKVNREELFSCLVKKYDTLNKSIATCQDDTSKLKVSIKDEKLKLEFELASLKSKTNKEIADLISLKSNVTGELTSIEKMYHDIVGDAQEEASSLVKTLSELNKAYDVMIEERNDFLNNLSGLLSTVSKDMNEEYIGMKELGNKVC